MSKPSFEELSNVRKVITGTTTKLRECISPDEKLTVTEHDSVVTYYAACCSGLPAPRAAAANRESLNLTYCERQTDLQCGFLSVLFGHQRRMDVANFVKLQLCALLKAKGYWMLLDVPISVAEILSLVSMQILEITTINSPPIYE